MKYGTNNVLKKQIQDGKIEQTQFVSTLAREEH